MKKLGIVLIVVGLLMTIITGFNVITKEKVVDVGKLEISKEEKTPIYWSPIVGLILLASGIMITVSSKGKVV